MNHDNNKKKIQGVISKKEKTMKPPVKDYKALYENEKAKNEALYEGLFQNQKTIMLLVDPVTLKIVDANHAAVAFYGYPYSVLTQMDISRIDSTFSKEALEKNISQTLRSGKNIFYRKNTLANKQVRDVEVHSGKIISAGRELLFVTIYDITERVKAIKELEQNELKFRKIFNTSPDSITISSIDNGKYVEVNESFTTMTGYSPEEVIGKTSIELNIWADKKDRERWVKILIKNGVVRDFATRFRLKDGSIIHGLMSANMININGVSYILAVTKNIEKSVKARRELEQSELKFRKAFAISPYALAITNLKTGRYHEVNELFMAETGYARKEIIGKTAKELNIWVDYRQRQKLKKVLKEKGYAKDFPLILRMKNGNKIRAMVSANIIDIDGEPHIISMTRSIEDYLKALEAFRHSEQRYKTLFNLSPAGVMVIDETGTILEANPTYCNNLSYPETEIVGKKIWDVVNNPSQETKEQIMDYIPKIPRNRVAKKEVVNLDKNGNPIYLQLYETRIVLENDQTAVLSISVDVTKEKHYLEEMARQAESLKEAQEIGRFGSWELNWRERKLSWSDGIYQILNIDKSQKPDYDLFQQHIHPDDLEMARQVLKESVKTGKGFKYIHRLRPEKGHVKWVIERGKSFYDERGRVFRTHGTVQDITRLKEAEDKLKEMNKLLEKKVHDRTAKLRKKQRDLSKLLNDMQMVQKELQSSNTALKNLNHELEAFSYSVSHDLKAPLRAIHGFTAILKEDYFDALPPDGKELLEDILRETDHMSEIIEALLLLSRIGRKNLSFVEFDLKPLAISVFSEQKKLYQLPHARLEVGNLPKVYADYSLVKQLMANLLSNALKYSAKEPSPLVEIDYMKEEGTGDNVFYVKDNGVGFDEGAAGKMFEAFRRLHSKKEFEGTGIGLAIAKRIVTRHGGKIWAKGRKGEGATVFFKLSESNKPR